MSFDPLLTVLGLATLTTPTSAASFAPTADRAGINIQPAGSLPITNPVAGDLFVDALDGNRLKWYDGSGWQDAGGGGAAGADGELQFSLSGVLASSTDMVFDTTDNRLALTRLSVTPESGPAIIAPVAGQIIIDSNDGNRLTWYDGTAWRGADIGAVFSVNGQTGTVVIGFGDLAAPGSEGDIHFTDALGFTTASTGFNYAALTGTLTVNSVAYTWPLADGAGVLTSDGAGNLSWSTSGGAVTSVNGQTGDVVLTAENLTFGGLSYTWPTSDGFNGYVLSTDGSGNLGWYAALGVPAGNNGEIQYNNGGSFGGSALTYNSNLTGIATVNAFSLYVPYTPTSTPTGTFAGFRAFASMDSGTYGSNATIVSLVGTAAAELRNGLTQYQCIGITASPIASGPSFGGGGTLTELIGVLSAPGVGPNTLSEVTVTKLYGIRIAPEYVGSTSGTVDTYYGVYIASPPSPLITTTKYGIYQSDYGAKNYFAAVILLGDASSAVSGEVLASRKDYGAVDGFSINANLSPAISSASAGHLIVLKSEPRITSTAGTIANVTCLLAEGSMPSSGNAIITNWYSIRSSQPSSVGFGDITNFYGLYLESAGASITNRYGIYQEDPASRNVFFGLVETASDKAYYIGDSSTDGSWRMSRSGNNLVMERRESGIWVTKQTILA